MNGSAFEPLDENRLLVEKSFLPLLRAYGLNRFASLMSLKPASVVRAVPGRSTVRLELAGPDAGRIALYLKRFEPDYLSPGHVLLRRLCWPGADDEALREWRKILRLQQSGFLTAAPVAIGQSKSRGVVTQSLLMTQEIAGGIQADHYFSERLRSGPVRRKWRWLAGIGRFARRFQDARFIHKDFYLSHIFVVEDGEDWRFHLIDLQRVRGPSWHLPRWYVKDLAALTFSARVKAGCSGADLLRIYQAFAGTKKLSPADKRLIRKLWRRSGQLQRRPPKYRRIWNQPPADR